MQERRWSDSPKAPSDEARTVKRVHGMAKAAEKGELSFQGWPTGHVVALLWGSGGGRIVEAMRHSELCAAASLYHLTLCLHGVAHALVHHP